MDNAIIPECYIDTNLIVTITPPKGKRYNHTKGCSSVAKKMQEKFGDSFAVGIVDKDKRVLEYKKEFTVCTNYKNQLELLKHKTKHHYLIYIIPEMEEWIEKCAQEVNVNFLDYDIVYENMKELKKITKTVDSDKDDRFRRLFKELKKENAESVIKLSKWIEYLRDNNYKVDIETLKQL
jgi:hypothetical protein